MNRTSIKKLTFLTILLFLLCFTAGNALADDSAQRAALFAPAVVDNNSCTLVVNPGQSIQAAVENAQSGQIVCVRAGTYHEQVKLQPPDSGITLMAYPGERPIIDGRGVLPGTTANNQNMGLIHISGSNVTVDGFDVRNSAIRGVNVVQAPNTNVVLHDVIVRNMIIHGSQEMGLIAKGDDVNKPYNILFENNEVYENLLNNADNHEGGSALTFIEVRNGTARGNVVYRNIGEGLVAGRFTQNITLEGNTSYDNQHSNVYIANTINPVVRGNFVYCTDDRAYWSEKTPRKPSPGITLRDEDFEKLSTRPGPSSGQVIINNIVVGCGINFGVSTQINGGGLNDALVANNTFVNARGDSGASINNVRFEGDVNLRNTRFYNNLILQEVPGSMVRILTALGDPDLSTFQLADNLYSHTPENDWPGNEAGRVVADPKLVNPAVPVRGANPNPANYGLQTNSPAINTGTAVSQVTHDFFGQQRSGALDIGADELTGSPPTTDGQIIVVMETIPVGDPQVFQFSSNFAGSFELTHSAERVAELAPGTYNVSLTIPNNWLLSSALCSDGSQPNAINLAASEIVICTFIGLKQDDDGGDGGDLAAKVYLATYAAGSVGGVNYSPGDIVVYDGPTDTWSLFFDGSDVGLSKPINEFEIMSDGSLLMALNGTNNLSGPGGAFKLLMQDVARFRPSTSSTGDNTAGTWELYFDGSDVGLSTSAEKIDALALRNDGALLISTMGKASVSGVTGQDEDLLAFRATATGSNTAGNWALALDGSQMAGMNTEDVTAAWVDTAAGIRYLAVMDDFNVNGVSGDNRTILAVTSTYAVSIFWNAADAGFPGPIDALEIVFTP